MLFFKDNEEILIFQYDNDYLHMCDCSKPWNECMQKEIQIESDRERDNQKEREKDRQMDETEIQTERDIRGGVSWYLRL